MANEIYNSTWWGDASWSARTLLEGYADAEILGGQLELQSRVEIAGGELEYAYCASEEFHKKANI